MPTRSFITSNFHRYDPSSIDSYIGIGGFTALKKALEMGGDAVCQRLSSAQIKGRGGAAYDMGRKWTQAKSVIRDHKLIICNADEGEPCTFKDREILKNDPFNLIEAMVIAGVSIDAQDGYIYMREEYAYLRPQLLSAIRQAEEKGFLGDNVLGSGCPFHIRLYSGAGAYVCGEGTALIRSIEGKAGRPRMKPPFIKVSGLFALPTCVNNVESLAIVPHLLLDDEDVYINAGTKTAPGTKLVSVAGNVNKPGVYEIEFGTTVREIVEDLAGGIKGGRRLRLIQFGGASGCIADASVLDVPYAYDTLKEAGVTVGSGAILVVDERTSVLDFLLTTQRFFSHESCGQCTPCREGNLHLKNALEAIKAGTATRQTIDNIRLITRVMPISALCGLGEGAPNALLTALKIFPETFQIGGRAV